MLAAAEPCTSAGGQKRKSANREVAQVGWVAHGDRVRRSTVAHVGLSGEGRIVEKRERRARQESEHAARIDRLWERGG